MIIKLFKDYYIETIPRNYVLKKDYMGKDKNENPKEQTLEIGYYTTIESALRALIKIEAMGSEEEYTLNEYLESVRKLNEELNISFEVIAKEVEK